ncbi:MAG: low molecular weight protein-tyrosine-phosphatase [Luteibaculaceae bacterium]
MHILMVCLGNICRSPLAEGILREKARQKGLQITTDSCGTAGYHVGSPADSRSIFVAKNKGVDISDLRARKFSRNDFDSFDLIFTMDSQNTQDVLQLAKTENDKKKVIQILSVLENGKTDVPDPYYGTMADFEEVYEMLDEVCELILARYVK